MLDRKKFCRLCFGRGTEKSKGPSFGSSFRGLCDECDHQPTGVERLEQQGLVKITHSGIHSVKLNIEELIERE